MTDRLTQLWGGCLYVICTVHDTHVEHNNYLHGSEVILESEVHTIIYGKGSHPLTDPDKRVTTNSITFIAGNQVSWTAKLSYSYNKQYKLWANAFPIQYCTNLWLRCGGIKHSQYNNYVYSHSYINTACFDFPTQGLPSINDKLTTDAAHSNLEISPQNNVGERALIRFMATSGHAWTSRLHA